MEQTHVAVIQRTKGASLGIDLAVSNEGVATIAAVVAGSPSQLNNNIEVGDAVLSVNGTAVESIDEVRNALFYAGTTVKLGVCRPRPKTPVRKSKLSLHSLVPKVLPPSRDDDAPASSHPRSTSVFAKWTLRLFCLVMIACTIAIISGQAPVGPLRPTSATDQIMHLALYVISLLVAEVALHEPAVQQVILGVLTLTFGALAAIGTSVVGEALDVQMCCGVSAALYVAFCESMHVKWSRYGILLVIFTAYYAHSTQMLDGLFQLEPAEPPPEQSKRGRRSRKK